MCVAALCCCDPSLRQAVSDDIWYRVIHIVTNHEGLQPYAAAKVFQAVSAPNANENTVKISAYMLGVRIVCTFVLWRLASPRPQPCPVPWGMCRTRSAAPIAPIVPPLSRRACRDASR